MNPLSYLKLWSCGRQGTAQTSLGNHSEGYSEIFNIDSQCQNADFTHKFYTNTPADFSSIKSTEC